MFGARLLGKGSFGTVTEDIDRDTDQPIAIKTLGKNYSSCTEVELLNMLRDFDPSHTGYNHIVHARDTSIYDDRVIIIMDKMDGTLLELLQDYPEGMPTHMIKTILKQVCYGLSYIHYAGLVHCDIKLENILFRCDGEDEYHIAISDFGNALTLQEASDLRGWVIQNNSYRCFENVVGSHRASTASDLSSMASMAYELASGRYFQFEEDPMEHALQIMECVGKHKMCGLQGDKAVMTAIKELIPKVKSQHGILYELIQDRSLISLIQTWMHPCAGRRGTAMSALQHEFLADNVMCDSDESLISIEDIEQDALISGMIQV